MSVRGAAYAAVAAMLYGSAYVATAIALESFGPASVAAWRGLLGAAVLGAALLLPAMSPLRPARVGAAAALRLATLGVVGGGLFVLAMNGAVAAAGATVTAFVAGLYAVLAAALAVPLLGERLERSTLAALLVALLGTALLAELDVAGDTVTGVLVALVAAGAFGLFLVLTRRWIERYALGGATIGLAVLSLGGAIAVAVTLAVGAPLMPIDPEPNALLALLWLATGPSAAASVLVVLGMRKLPARHASAFLLLNPPTAAVLAVVLLGESLSGLQLVGAACVLVAMAVAVALPAFRETRR